MENKAIKIGFIGLGVMGKSMAGHILDAGFSLHVFTRTKSKAQTLIDKGAVWEDSVSRVSQKCDVIISIVGFPDDVKQIYLGDEGIIHHAKKKTIAIDMTTSTPQLAKQICKAGLQKDIFVLDAPVSGGDIGAQNATLSIMVGGDKKSFEKVLPVLKIMGKNVVYQGEAGSGQNTKVVNQMAIAAGMVAVCEAISYAKKAGLDLDRVLKSIGQGAAGSWSLNNLAPRMIRQDFEPGFYIKHFIKDLKIAKDASKQEQLNTPGLDLVLSLYEKLAEQGLDNKGTQALFKLFQ